MKALIFKGPMQLELEEIEEPTLAPGDLLVEVDAVGICGSDIHGFSGETGRRRPGMTMGHEAAGRVVAFGGDVDGWSVGDLVTFNPVLGCGVCAHCRLGASNLCAERTAIGVDARYRGAFAERVSLPARNAVRLENRGLGGAIVEPLAVGIHAARRAGVAPGETVAVAGAGMIGLACVWAAFEEGAKHVYASDLDPDKIAFAASLGARGVLAPDPLLDALRADGVGPADRAIDAVGVSASLQDAIDATRRNGTTCLVGMGSPQVELKAYALVTEERNVTGTYCYGEQDFRDAAKAIERGSFPADTCIDAEISLEDAPEVFVELASGRRRSIKTIVRPNA